MVVLAPLLGTSVHAVKLPEPDWLRRRTWYLVIVVSLGLAQRNWIAPLADGVAVRPPGAAGVARLPFTLWAALFEMAFAPRPRPAAVAPSRASAIAPPFRVSAAVPMLIPSASLSAAATA